MSKTIEERLQWTEDMIQIQQKIYLFAVAIDTRNWALLDKVFAPDCIIDYAATGESDGLSPADYVALVERVLIPLDVSQHTMSSPTIEIDGDTARSHTYGFNQHVMMSLAPHHQMLMAGWYDDEWVRIDGEWLIRHRHTKGAWAAGNPAVVGQKSIRGAEVPA